MARILIGTASWSDPEFVRDWYPKGLPAHRRLGFYAQEFEMVELNSSFYGIPTPRQVEQWTRSTPPGFVFNVKLHKLLSRHSCMKKMLPPPLQKLVTTTGKDRVVLTPELESAVTDAFLESLDPFERAGKLGVLLLQLSPAFSPRHNSLDELDALLDQLAGKKVAIEPRNRNWVEGERLNELVQYCQSHGVTLVSVDAPQSKNFNVMPAIDVVTTRSTAYLRLHGRNAHGYISGRSVAERFDHFYTEEELDDVHQRVDQLAAGTDVVHVVFNNNRSDYAPKNALRFRKMLGQQVSVQPEGLF